MTTMCKDPRYSLIRSSLGFNQFGTFMIPMYSQSTVDPDLEVLYFGKLLLDLIKFRYAQQRVISRTKFTLPIGIETSSNVFKYHLLLRLCPSNSSSQIWISYHNLYDLLDALLTGLLLQIFFHSLGSCMYG